MPVEITEKEGMLIRTDIVGCPPELEGAGTGSEDIA